jgi:hypothetical protein
MLKTAPNRVDEERAAQCRDKAQSSLMRSIERVKAWQDKPEALFEKVPLKRFKFKYAGPDYLGEGVIDADGFVAIGDCEVNTLMLILSQLDSTLTTRRIADALFSNMAARFNPMKNYFMPLYGKWQGRDYISELFSCLPLDHASEIPLQVYFKKWLVAMVRSALGICYNELICCIVGPEGYGKTTFFYDLLPHELKRYCNACPKEMLGTKDARIALTENVLQVIDECGDLPAQLFNLINELATLPTVNARRAYARTAEDMPRHASFCATGNSSTFLRTPHGSRRWVVLHLAGRIDRNRLASVPRHAMFAQAMSLALDPSFVNFLTGEEVSALTSYNFRHSLCIEAKLFLQSYRQVAEGEVGKWYTVERINERISIHGFYKLSLDMLKEVLDRYDVPTRKNAYGSSYYLIEMLPHEIEAGAPCEIEAGTPCDGDVEAK